MRNQFSIAFGALALAVSSIAVLTTSAQAKRVDPGTKWAVIVVHSEADAATYGSNGWEPVGIESHLPIVPSGSVALAPITNILMKKAM